MHARLLTGAHNYGRGAPERAVVGAAGAARVGDGVGGVGGSYCGSGGGGSGGGRGGGGWGGVGGGGGVEEVIAS